MFPWESGRRRSHQIESTPSWASKCRRDRDPVAQTSEAGGGPSSWPTRRPPWSRSLRVLVGHDVSPEDPPRVTGMQDDLAHFAREDQELGLI